MMQRKEGAPRRVRIAGPAAGRWAGAVWPGLVRIIAADFRAVNTPKTVPHVPL